MTVHFLWKIQRLTLHTTVQNITSNLYKNMGVSMWNLYMEFQSDISDYLTEYHTAYLNESLMYVSSVSGR